MVFKNDENSVCSMTNSEFSNFNWTFLFVKQVKVFVKDVKKANIAKFV
jgi:hypothetical protein